MTDEMNPINGATGTLAGKLDELPHLLSSYWRAIPPQIPHFWLEGQFNLAPYRSDRYNRLGWSLLVRGIYWYEVQKLDPKGRDFKFMHGGIALIDFERSSEALEICGLRVLGVDARLEVAIWKSTMCRLDVDGESDKASFQFAYSFQEIGEDHHGEDAKQARNLAEPISKSRLGSKPLQPSFVRSMQSKETFKLFELLQRFTAEKGLEFGKKKYALVICEGIQDSSDPIKAFTFSGRYLPTQGDASEDMISFSRIL